MPSSPVTSAKAGRPKKLNRTHAIEQALDVYWSKGLDNVSLNEICRQTSMAKASFYNEFGSEDDFHHAIFAFYEQSKIQPFFAEVSRQHSIKLKLEKATEMIVKGFSADHRGCLLAQSYQSQLGSEATHYLKQYKASCLQQYASWIEQAKFNNEIRSSLDTQLGAAYICSQFSNAALLQSQGESPEVISKLLAMAFSIFTN